MSVRYEGKKFELNFIYQIFTEIVVVAALASVLKMYQMAKKGVAHIDETTELSHCFGLMVLIYTQQSHLHAIKVQINPLYTKHHTTDRQLSTCN